MLPDWVSNPEPLTYKSGALPIALRGPATFLYERTSTEKGGKYNTGKSAVPESVLICLNPLYTSGLFHC